MIEDGFIREREVMITTGQPLGVWRVEGVEVVPLLRELPHEPAAQAAALAQRVDAATGSPAQRRHLEAWLLRHGLTAVRSASSE